MQVLDGLWRREASPPPPPEQESDRGSSWELPPECADDGLLMPLKIPPADGLDDGMASARCGALSCLPRLEPTAELAGPA